MLKNNAETIGTTMEVYVKYKVYGLQIDRVDDNRTLYISVPGNSELTLNGKEASGDYLAALFSDSMKDGLIKSVAKVLKDSVSTFIPDEAVRDVCEDTVRIKYRIRNDKWTLDEAVGLSIINEELCGMPVIDNDTINKARNENENN